MKRHLLSAATITETALQHSNGKGTQFVYDPDGNVTIETRHFADVTGFTQKCYDGADRLVEIEKPRDASSFYSFSWMTRYFYDLSGGAAALSIGASTGLSAHGNLYKTQEYLPGCSAGAAVSAGYWLDVRGTASDALDRPTAKYDVCMLNRGAQTIYSYDGQNSRGLLYTEGHASAGLKTLTYDQQNRITAASYSDYVTPGFSAVYDPDGRDVKMHSSQFGDEIHRYDLEGRLTC